MPIIGSSGGDDGHPILVLILLIVIVGIIVISIEHHSATAPKHTEQTGAVHVNRHPERIPRAASKTPPPPPRPAPVVHPINYGPVAVVKDVDDYEFGFWACRRVAAAVHCEGFVKDEFHHSLNGETWPKFALTNLVDNLGNQYQPQEMEINNASILSGGFGPYLSSGGSQPIDLKVDGVVSKAKSLILSMYLWYPPQPEVDFMLTLPIKKAP